MNHSTLALGRQLGRGGQGEVYQVTNKKINEADGGGWEVVYKEYNATVLPQLDAAALATSVALLGELSEAEGRWLCERTAWPAALVEKQGHASGFLMRVIPDRFQFTYQSLANTGPDTRRLANLEYLLNTDDYVTSIGLSVSEHDRLLLLADLAATLTRLHRIGITVGDLSPKNLLFTTTPKPECFLIDCDAMRLRGASVLPQTETPDWQIPAGEEKATPASDIYKLALLAIRLFARHQSATDPTALASLAPAIGDLARAGLNPDPALRPTPSAWAEQLTAAGNTASTIPAKTTVTGHTPSQSNASSTPRPTGRHPTGGPPAGTAPTPTNSPPGTKRPGLAPMDLALAAALVAIVLVAIMLPHNNSSPATDVSPQPTISQENTSGPSERPGNGYSDNSDTSSGDGDRTARDSSTPPSAEDEEFSAVSTDDCLSNYINRDTDWTPSTPTVTDCSDTDAYFRVTSIEQQGNCVSDDMTWFHSNSDGTDTNLCLDRNYADGQCMFAHAKDETLSIYNNAVTPCGAGIPDGYQYIVQLTRVYPLGAPDDACGDDGMWKPDSDAVLCGKVIWKRRGLPDM
ncbi:LppU/SCO3897 family protein [Nonomuraea sp. NPDC003707]